MGGTSLSFTKIATMVNPPNFNGRNTMGFISKK